MYFFLKHGLTGSKLDKTTGAKANPSGLDSKSQGFKSLSHKLINIDKFLVIKSSGEPEVGDMGQSRPRRNGVAKNQK